MGMARKPYPSDVTDEVWNFVAAYPTLMDEDAPQETVAGLHYVVFAIPMRVNYAAVRSA